MGCFSGISQIVLVFFNTVFVIVALIMFVAGIILRFFPGVFLKFLFDGISALVKDSFSVPDSFNDLANVPIFNALGLTAIVLAVILFVIAFLACCGACYKINIILGAFCALVVIMVLSIATVGGLMLSPSSPLHSTFKSELTKEVRSDYKGPTSGDVFSLAINVFSYSLDCCAMQGPNDFDHSASWTDNYKYKEQKIGHIDISPACCNGSILNSEIPDFSCARKTGGSGSSMKFDEKKTNTQGCYDKILSLIHDNQKYPIIIIVVLIAVLVIEMCFAIIIMRSEKVDPM